MVRRSRVQFRGPPAKKNKPTNGARADQHIKPISLLSQQFASKQSWVESVPDNQAITIANEDPLAGDAHVSSNRQSGAEEFIFPKIALPSNKTHDQQAEIHVEAHKSTATIASASPLSDSWFESPPASWVKLAPIYDRRRVPLIPDTDPSEFPEEYPSVCGGDLGHAEPASTSEPIQSASTNGGGQSSRTATPAPVSEPVPEFLPDPRLAPARSTRTLLQKIVELFAGRRKRPTPAKQKAHAEQAVPLIIANPEVSSEYSEPASTTDLQLSTTPEPKQEPEPPSAPRRAPPASFHPPLLTHAQVIPTVVKKNPCKLHNPSFHVSPAPTYFDTGKVFSTEDLHRAGIVQRGFRARHHPHEAIVTGHKRNHSAGQLLDRQGDVWANWYSKRQEVGSEPPRYMADSMVW